MHAICVQIDARPGDVAGNAARVRRALEPVTHADLVVLPEMCLAGYLYDSLEAIGPFLESPHGNDGPTLALAREIATKYQAHVIAGFAQRVEDVQEPTRPPVDMRRQVDDPLAAPHRARVHGKAFNAAMLVAPDGAPLKVFRKHFLYEGDTPWADEGPGFEYADTPLGRICVAICMDMNRASLLTAYCMFAPFDSFELASFCRDNKVDILVTTLAWLHPDTDKPDAVVSDMPSADMIWYWAIRLTPLHGHNARTIICNRIGREKSTLFGGTSTVLVHGERGVQVAGALGDGTEAALQVDC